MCVLLAATYQVSGVMRHGVMCVCDVCDVSCQVSGGMCQVVGVRGRLSRSQAICTTAKGVSATAGLVTARGKKEASTPFHSNTAHLTRKHVLLREAKSWEGVRSSFVFHVS